MNGGCPAVAVPAVVDARLTMGVHVQPSRTAVSELA